MPRKRVAQEAALTDESLTSEPTSLAGTIDQIVQDAEERSGEATFDPADFETQAAPAKAAARVERKRPGPITDTSVLLTDDSDGPQARLFRNEGRREMAIQFDEKPAPEITGQLREAGWDWLVKEKAWTIPLDPEAKWQTHANAQKLFKKVTDEIREANGVGASIS